MTVEFNRCETCGACDGRAVVLIKSGDAPKECANCHDTRTAGEIVVHSNLSRTETELQYTFAIISEPVSSTTEQVTEAG